MIKTFTIRSRGRKYFDCEVGNSRAKLIINTISNNIEINQTITAEVTDLSEHSKFGTTLKFDPIEILSADAAKAAQATARAAQGAIIARREAERRLQYAEEQARQGLCETKTIADAYRLCPDQPHLAERFDALKSRVAENAERRAAQKKQWAEEKNVRKEQWAKENTQRNAERDRRRQQRSLYTNSNLPDLNMPCRLFGRVIVYESYGKEFRIGESDSSVHGMHLWDATGQWGRYAYYRNGTPEEIAALEASENATAEITEEKEEKKEKITAIKTAIIAQGERPEGRHTVKGKVLLDDTNGYGGGTYFVIADEYIWYVLDNGGDGDDWSVNNVRTGGAGQLAIAFLMMPTWLPRLRH